MILAQIAIACLVRLRPRFQPPPSSPTLVLGTIFAGQLALTLDFLTVNEGTAASPLAFYSWQALVNTSNQGTFSNTCALQFKSSNGSTVYPGDTTQTLTLTTNIVVVPEVVVVPEPRAIALAGIGIAAAAYAVRCRRTGC